MKGEAPPETIAIRSPLLQSQSTTELPFIVTTNGWEYAESVVIK